MVSNIGLILEGLLSRRSEEKSTIKILQEGTSVAKDKKATNELKKLFSTWVNDIESYFDIFDGDSGEEYEVYSSSVHSVNRKLWEIAKIQNDLLKHLFDSDVFKAGSKEVKEITLLVKMLKDKNVSEAWKTLKNYKSESLSDKLDKYVNSYSSAPNFEGYRLIRALESLSDDPKDLVDFDSIVWSLRILDKAMDEDMD